MKATLNWKQGMTFVGSADSGHSIQMDAGASVGGGNSGVRPMEMIALGLAGCTSMDVISIMQKKRQQVTEFDVQVHADRSADHPKVFTRAVITYVFVGKSIEEEAVLRSIELSATKYCPVHAMLEQAFPIDMNYEIYEDDENGGKQLIFQGVFQNLFHE
jgi:putative redox protein